MFAGFVSGSLQTIIGHPFDTLRVRLIASQYRLRGVYKGYLSALSAGCVSNAFLFGIEESLYDKNHWKSGFYSGFFSSFIIHPLEYIKCRNQIDQKICIQNMFRGVQYTVARESIGSAAYFYTFYHYNSGVGDFHAGGIAGITSWCLTFPLEVIKTRIQCDITAPFNYRNLGLGFLITMTRSYVVNAFLFYTYKRIPSSPNVN